MKWLACIFFLTSTFTSINYYGEVENFLLNTIDYLRVTPGLDTNHNKIQCKMTVAMVLCAKGARQNYTDFGCPYGEDVLKVKFSFQRQVNQTITAIKSILLSMEVLPNAGCLEIILFTNSKDAFENIRKEIYSWDASYTNSLRLSYRPALFPTEYKFLETNFAPCASLRLFIPQLLPDYNSVIYLDTDVLLFKNIGRLWEHFNFFSEQAIAGLAPDVYGFSTNKVVNFLKYPGKSGVNSGIILMNLERIRDRSLEHWIPSPDALISSKERGFDQDLLNKYFYQNPHLLHSLPCYWNFQAAFCRPELFCDTANGGIHALHAAGHKFTPIGTEPRFFEIFKEFQRLGMSRNEFNRSQFQGNVKSALERVPKRSSQCDEGRPDFNDIVIKGIGIQGS